MTDSTEHETPKPGDEARESAPRDRDHTDGNPTDGTVTPEPTPDVPDTTDEEGRPVDNPSG